MTILVVRPEVHVWLRDTSNPNFKIFKADTSKVEAAKRITNKCRSSKEIRPAPQLQGRILDEDDEIVSGCLLAPAANRNKGSRSNA